MAGELISLYEARAAATGFAFPPDDEMTRELRRRFPSDDRRQIWLESLWTSIP